VSDKIALIILLGILILATALRIYRLDAGLWLDEMLTYTNYAQMPFSQIITTYDSENQHFLYSILSHVSFATFGESAWSVRLPAVLFGVGSIWALYMLGREVTSNREALLATALFAFSYHHVWFSQNARGYTGLLFWAILSSLFFVRALREGRSRYWLLYAVSAALGVYTHITMIFMIMGQFAIYAIKLFLHRKEQFSNRWTGLFMGFGMAGFFIFLLYALIIPQVLGVIGGSEASVVAEWKNPLWTLQEFINGLQVSLSGGIVAAAAVAIAALLLLSAGLVSYLRSEWIVVAMLLIPAIIGAVVTIAIGHHLWPRFFFFTFGFGALIVIRGITVGVGIVGRLFNFSDQRIKLIGTVASLLLIIVSFASALLAFGPKQDFEGALAFVESNRSTGDAVATFGLAANVYKSFYDVDWEFAETKDELDAVQKQADRTWVLYTFPPVAESLQPDIMADLNNEFRLIKEFPGTVRQGTVYVKLSERQPAG